MRLRPAGLAFACVLVVLCVPLAAEAQAGKVPRLGYLSPGSWSDQGGQRLREAFLQGLRDLGWVAGQNIVIETRFAEGRDEQLPTLAADLVQLRADIIVAVGSQTTRATKQATSTILILMVSAAARRRVPAIGR